MWLRQDELHRAGLRRRSDGYWKAERRFGLPANAYVSVFAREFRRPAAARLNSPKSGPGEGRRRGRRADPRAAEVSAFHVTFVVGRDNVHFYYHESDDRTWSPGGHTTAREVRALAADPAELRAAADAVAAVLVAALGGECRPRTASAAGRGGRPA